MSTLPERQPVFNLHVEGCHEFFANGILVHNCLAAPNGAHDDTIDAVVIPLRYMVENRGRGRIRRDLLHLTDEEQEQLRSEDAAAGKTLCEQCVGLGCAACGHSGFVMAAQQDDLRAIFDAACAGREGAELGVSW